MRRRSVSAFSRDWRDELRPGVSRGAEPHCLVNNSNNERAKAEEKLRKKKIKRLHQTAAALVSFEKLMAAVS